MSRLQKLKDFLKKEKIDALLVSDIKNITYYCGFTGSVGIMLFLKDKAFLLVDGRYVEQAKREVEHVKVVEIPLGSDIWSEAVELARKSKTKRIGFEDNRVSVATYHGVQDRLSGDMFKPVGKKLESERVIKDAKEIKLIKDSAKLCTLIYDCVKRIIKVGMTELEVANEIDYLVRTMGAEFSSFETLVSSGENTAFPHGKPTKKAISRGDLVQLDFGARLSEYSSDISRVMVAGRASDRQKHIYNLVLEAQLVAINKVKEGVLAGEVDEAARKVLRKGRMEKYLKHGIGHGVGLAVHEQPRISIGGKEVLKRGMVFTVEPGVYVPGWGGVRIEDMVLVTKKGCEVLTDTSKALEVFS